MKTHQNFVEIKTVTWSKDSHGLFDYESKNVNYTKTKVETSSKLYKDGSEVMVKGLKDVDLLIKDKAITKEPNFLFSIITDNDKNSEKFQIKVDDMPYKGHEDSKADSLFLIVRSLKNEDGTQKGYNLELGDIIRLGRIEYRVLEFQDHLNRCSSLLINPPPKKAPFDIIKKEVLPNKTGAKRECRICFMDENDSEDLLVNPCNCKGTSEYVHIKCVQDWISSKIKKKINPDVACFYWKRLNCEVCKVPLPDLILCNNASHELIPIERQSTPYILLERVFYDKTKENGDHSKILVLLNLLNLDHQIKLGRGHECDLRENDISVSRFHAHIKYQNGNFVIVDNNSKFGTLVYLRKSLAIEKKKVAIQIGRTVMTFSLKHTSINNIPVFKNPMLMDKLGKAQSPKGNYIKSLHNGGTIKHKTTLPMLPPEEDKHHMNGSFLD